MKVAVTIELRIPLQHALTSLWERRQWAQPGGVRLPLVATMTLLLVVQVLGVSAWRQAREVNARWLDAESPYFHSSTRASAPDVMLRRFSDTIAAHSCEIDRPTVCDKVEGPTSPTLTAVNIADLPAASRRLLEQNSYSSADHFLVALLFNGQEAALPGTMTALVRTGKLTSIAVHRFLYEWLLRPAVTYYGEGRAEDAAALFVAFVENEVAALSSGVNLLGVDDVDITDLAALFDAFCRGSGNGPLEPCSIPFLHALSAGKASGRGWDPMGEGIPSFLASYRQAPGSSPDLVSYLEMERRVGDTNSPLESWSPDALPFPARYLGYFAKGRHLASTLGTGTACLERREAASADFRRAGSLALPRYFLTALQEATDDLARRPPCATTRP